MIPVSTFIVARYLPRHGPEPRRSAVERHTPAVSSVHDGGGHQRLGGEPHTRYRCRCRRARWAPSRAVRWHSGSATSSASPAARPPSGTDRNREHRGRGGETRSGLAVRLPGLAVTAGVRLRLVVTPTVTLAGWRLAVALTLAADPGRSPGPGRSPDLAPGRSPGPALALTVTLALALPLVVALTWRAVVALAGPRLHGFLTLSPVIRIGKTHNNHASLSCYCKPDSTTRPRTGSSTEHQSCTNRY